MVLNTSFNENEPIVDTPEQALDCFRRTDMDALCLGRVFARQGQELMAAGACDGTGICSVYGVAMQDAIGA